MTREGPLQTFVSMEQATEAAKRLFVKNHPEYGIMKEELSALKRREPSLITEGHNNVTLSGLEWAPKSAPMALKFNGTNLEAVHNALFRTFGKFPLQLNRFEHETVLVGMMNAAGEGATPYKILRDALTQFGEIEVRLA